MEWLLIGVARLVLPILQAMPLPWVAWLGRQGGALAWLLDARHRRVALENLARCFGTESTPDRLRAVARENFRRIGEAYACGIRTATMSWDQLRPYLDLGDFGALREACARHPDRSVIVAIGHFGNFEIFTWVRMAVPGIQGATTYRALRQEMATRLLMDLRRQSGCLYFERRRDAQALRNALAQDRILLGLLADQHDGRGVRVPFLGQDAWTSVAPAVLAQRYGCPLFSAFCFRTGPARWRLELGDAIETRDAQGRRLPLSVIAHAMNRSFETAIRRDPANWFWVHRRWKPGRSPASPSPTPPPGPAPTPSERSAP